MCLSLHLSLSLSLLSPFLLKNNSRLQFTKANKVLPMSAGTLPPPSPSRIPSHRHLPICAGEGLVPWSYNRKVGMGRLGTGPGLCWEEPGAGSLWAWRSVSTSAPRIWCHSTVPLTIRACCGGKCVSGTSLGREVGGPCRQTSLNFHNSPAGACWLHPVLLMRN